MKLIRKNTPQIEAFKWEGNFTKELKMMLARHSYKDYSILSEQEVKQKYEVLK
jgi:hypothetical protein